MHAFVRTHKLLASNKELEQQLKKLERTVASRDEAIVGILKTIRQLMDPPETSKRSRFCGTKVKEEGLSKTTMPTISRPGDVPDIRIDAQPAPFRPTPALGMSFS